MAILENRGKSLNRWSDYHGEILPPETTRRIADLQMMVSGFRGFSVAMFDHQRVQFKKGAFSTQKLKEGPLQS